MHRNSRPRCLAVGILLLSGCALQEPGFLGKSCATDDDCPGGLACDPTGHFCHEGCRPACPSGSWCNLQSCQPCTVDSHCGPGCGACGAPTPWCDGTACAQCRSDSDCSTAAASHCEQGQCVQCRAQADCSAPSQCCRGTCELPAAPSLAAVSPPVLFAGSPAQTLTLTGSGFSACGRVAFNGTTIISRWSDSTHLEADVPASALEQAGTYAVQAINPGDLESNPNSTALGETIDFSMFDDYVWAPLFLNRDTAAISLSSPDGEPALERVDLAGWKLANADPIALPGYGSPRTMAASQGTVLVGLVRSDGSSPSAVALGDPLQMTRDPILLALQGDANAIDSDDAGKFFIAEGSQIYQTYSLTEGLHSPIQLANVGSGAIVGVAVLPSISRVLLAWSNESLFVFDPAAPASGQSVHLPVLPLNMVALAADRAHNRALVVGATRLAVFDPTTGSVASSEEQTATFSAAAINPISQLGAVVTAGGDILAMVDLATSQVIGLLGPAKPTSCANSYTGIALDPATNRALTTNQCSAALKGFNLNVVFVDNPVPTITSFDPPSIAAHTAASVTIRGSGFLPVSEVDLGNSSTPTKLTVLSVARDALQVSIPETAISCGGLVQVKVSNPAPGGGSASLGLPVSAPTPAATGVTYSCSTGCLISVEGSSFLPGCSLIVVSGTSYATTGSASLLRAIVPSLQLPVPVYVSTPGAAAPSDTIQVGLK